MLILLSTCGEANLRRTQAVGSDEHWFNDRSASEPGYLRVCHLHNSYRYRATVLTRRGEKKKGNCGRCFAKNSWPRRGNRRANSYRPAERDDRCKPRVSLSFSSRSPRCRMDYRVIQYFRVIHIAVGCKESARVDPGLRNRSYERTPRVM